MIQHHARPRRAATDLTRRNIMEDFPEIGMIPDAPLREKVVDAWAYSLCCSDFTRIAEIPPDGNPGAPVLRHGTQADHLRGVFRYARAIALEFEQAYPETRIDWDILLAGAACHDVGKPYEFDPANRRRWSAAPAESGFPTFRHSVFGMHVCLTVGLPDGRMHDRAPGRPRMVACRGCTGACEAGYSGWTGGKPDGEISGGVTNGAPQEQRRFNVTSSAN